MILAELADLRKICMILANFAVILKTFISACFSKRVIFKLGQKMAGVEDYEIDLESNATGSVFGNEKTNELRKLSRFCLNLS